MLRYVHGSEDSLDVDVYYVFNEMPSFRECQEFCSSKEENRNIIVVRNGIVTECFKGTIDEVNNGLLYTYHLHEQENENIVKFRVERDVLIKVIRVVRCLLSHCSRTNYREDVKKALKSSNWHKRLDVLKSVDWTSIEDYGKSGSKEDVHKVFAFQIGQTLSLLKNVECYTKSTVALKYPQLKKYLYREKSADIQDLICYIHKFLDIVSLFEVEEKDGITTFKEFNKSIDLKTEKYI